VTTAAPPADLLDQLEALQAGRPIRQAELPGDVPAPDGWQRDRLVHLVFRGPAPEPAPEVTETGRDALRDLRREWIEGEFPHAAAVLLAGDERLFTATPTRGFAVRDAAGTPVSMSLLVGDGDVQLIEDVYTTPAHRGAGHAAALVRTLVAAALAGGAGLVHVPTAADGRARALYERLGFEPVATTTRLTKVV
jgi:GNAT superfamily N-acetyltransferase